MPLKDEQILEAFLITRSAEKAAELLGDGAKRTTIQSRLERMRSHGINVPVYRAKAGGKFKYTQEDIDRLNKLIASHETNTKPL